MALSLPQGRNGQILALSIAVIGAAAIWLGAVAPLLDWYGERAATLRRQQAMADRMAALVETLPALRQAAADAASMPDPAGALLPGASDALAAGQLQQRLDELAAAAGVRIASEEILPAQPSGEFRAIAVRVTLTAPWRSLVGLLLGMAKSAVPMMADEMQLHGPPGTSRDATLPVDASFTVIALRRAGT